MTTKKNNTPDSGLIELSKFRESLASVTQNDGLDESLLSEHVPALRVDKPRRKELGAVGIAAAASVLLGLSSAAYALHHQVTQHRNSTVMVATKTVETDVDPPALAFVTPRPIEVAPVEEPAIDAPVAPVAAAVSPVATSSSRARSTAPRRIPAPAPAAPSVTDRSIDALLNAATGGQVTPREGATRPAESTLPQRPARAHVSSSFRGMSRAIQACGDGEDGVVSARATVDGASGRVRSVSLSGVSGEAERCMERALMSVRLDPFQQDQLEITFPYRL
ncbi:MAG: hypothetical protein AB8H86_21330 [Polyangiales bacterium]